MPYGPEKYSAPVLARNITEVIGDHLARFSAFNNTSVCYFGARLKYRIEIELFSRGNTKELLEKETILGANPTLEEETDPALGIEAEMVVVEGNKSAGRVPAVSEAPPVKAGDGKPAAKPASRQPTGSVQRPQRTTMPNSLGAGEAGRNTPPVSG